MKRHLKAVRSASGCRVWLDGVEITATLSQKLRNHSPDGFELGYNGSGPSQLALAILLYCGWRHNEVLAWYQQFRSDVIASIGRRDVPVVFAEIDPEEWLEKKQKAQAAACGLSPKTA